MTTGTMHIATICTRSYLPRARVLAASFSEYVPEGRVSALVLDAMPGDADEPLLDIVPVDDVIDATEFARMATAYDVVELATALKPTLLAHLLQQSDAVHYLDPDIRFHGDPQFLNTAALEWDIVLTPHLTTPPAHARGGGVGGEDAVLPAGVFNLGYIGVSRAARTGFLPWWQDRLARDCLDDIPRARFVDQRWIDLVPGYFRHQVVTHPGVNLAWWNMPQRPVERVDGQWRVAGHPLVFVHASGVDPHAAGKASRYHDDGHPFQVQAGSPLQALLDDYRAAVLDAGHGAFPPPEHGLRRAAGLVVTRDERRRYLDALVRFEQGEGAEPPNPFEHGIEAFTSWLDDAPRDAAVIESPGGRRTRGVNVVGHFTSPSGVGTIARLVTEALRAQGIPHSTYDLDDHNGTPGEWQHRSEGLFDTTLICANADEAQAVNHRLHPELRACTRVGIWWWETEDFPSRYRDAFHVVDEVWTGSDFARRAIAVRSDRPVRLMPVPIAVTPDPVTDIRRRLGIADDAFLVASVISLDSIVDRKNPLGVIDAYRRAFAADDGAVLVLKVMGRDPDAHIEHLRFAAAGRADIQVVAATWTTADVHGLLATCDCLLALHRSEGFGLVMAEAMAYGRPVIATAYGGNLQFMDEECAFLIPAVPVPITRSAQPYAAGGTWADPDTDAAAACLRMVRQDPAEAARKGALGRARISAEHSLAHAGEAIAAMLDGTRPPARAPHRPWRRRGRGGAASATPGTRSAPSGGAAFYHSMELPDGRRFDGDWSLLDIDAYLGGVPLHGRRVLDAGTATGALAFAAEQRGAREVVALDLPFDVEYDPRVPVDDEHRRRALDWRFAVRQSFFLCHSALGSMVNHVTGDLRDLRTDLGRFDVGVLGNVLQHLRDPSGALLALAGICNVMVVTEADWMHGRVPDDLSALIAFDSDQPFSWYQARPAWVSDLLSRNGFEDIAVSHHIQRYNGHPSDDDGRRPEPVDVPHFTVVAWHKDVPSRDRQLTIR